MWMGIGIIGPEFVLTYASGQWGTVRESVQAFHASGYTQWSMRHAFFADMGGFLLVPRDSKPFRITAKSLHYLVTKDYLRYPEVRTEELWDKSKQDKIAKAITCVQVFYLVVQCIGRALQNFAVTPLELSALAIVVCSILTSICWWSKPLDVRTPIKLYMSMSTEELLKEAGDAAAKPYKQTPLDFVDDLCPSWSLNVQAFIKMPVAPRERPIPRFGNDRFPNLKGYQESFLCFATLAYAAIHLFGWNSTFPTKTELILWRLSSMFLFVNTVMFWVCETIAAWQRKGRWERIFYRIFDSSKLEDVENARQARIAARTPKVLPLKSEFWSIFPLAVTYAAARGYLIMEVFTGLRSLEASAYVNVNWAAFIPHI